MIKLAALGAVGYIAYKFFENGSARNGSAERTPAKNAVAGGPLSEDAEIKRPTSPSVP